MPDQVNEVKPEEEIKPDTNGKFPETVPWNKYVGIKESLGKKLDAATAKVASLEEQLKKSPNAEEFTKTKAELDTIKAEHAKAVAELNSSKEKTISEKRSSLISKGIPEDKVKGLSEKELDAISGVLGDVKTFKPKPDFGGSGSSSDVPIRPRDRINRGFESLHPTR